MLLFLLLLLVVGGAIAVYAVQNPAVHDVTIWQYHWPGVPTWVPVALAAIGVAIAFLGYLSYAGLRTGIRHGFLRRRIWTHESAIGDLRREIQLLREENARLKSEVRVLNRTVPAAQPAEWRETAPVSPATPEGPAAARWGSRQP